MPDGHTYLRVRWLHDLPDEPVDLWYELDQSRFTTRVLEFFRDGTVAYASATEEVGGAGLSEEEVSPLSEIASDPQFAPEDIGKEEFERRWERRLTQDTWRPR